MFEMNGITPESLVEPIDVGVGQITLDMLGMTPESSPFHQPPQEPEVILMKKNLILRKWNLFLIRLGLKL